MSNHKKHPYVTHPRDEQMQELKNQTVILKRIEELSSKNKPDN